MPVLKKRNYSKKKYSKRKYSRKKYSRKKYSKNKKRKSRIIYRERTQKGGMDQEGQQRSDDMLERLVRAQESSSQRLLEQQEQLLRGQDAIISSSAAVQQLMQLVLDIVRKQESEAGRAPEPGATEWGRLVGRIQA